MTPLQCSFGCSLKRAPAITTVVLSHNVLPEIGEYHLCRYHREAIARKDWRSVTILEEHSHSMKETDNGR